MTERQNKKNKNQSPKPKAHNPKPEATGYGLRATGAGGFSFIEVLVSIFLITVGIMAAVSLFSKNLAGLIRDRNYVVASLLAQEGAELVRNIRDTNWANGRSAFAGEVLYLPADDAKDCLVDPRVTQLDDDTYCNGNMGFTPQLYFYAYNNQPYYLHEFVDLGAAETKFKRKVDITYDNGSAATASLMTVESMVIWGDAFPEALVDCTSAKKCAYVQSVLTTWDD